MVAVRERAYYRLFGADAAIGRLVGPETRVLDVGCSDGSGSVVLSGRSTFAADIYRPALERARDADRRSPVTQADARALPYCDGSFDIVTSLDVIEHFEKHDALTVLGELERVARRAVVVVTPCGFHPQPGTPEEPWQEHRCGFEATELQARGYEVEGLGGPAKLRGPYGTFRFGPVGQAMTLLSTRHARSRPETSFALLAVKRVDESR